VPEHARPDLVGGQQRGQITSLPPLDAPDLLEQFVLEVRGRAARVGERDEAPDRQLGGRSHLAAVLGQEPRVVRPVGVQRAPHVVQELRHALDQRRDQRHQGGVLRVHEPFLRLHEAGTNGICP
jgi:hypothetical protein